MLARSRPAAAAAANAVLRPLSLRLQYQQQWDRDFRRWVRQEGRDADPNDAADAEWASDLLDEGLTLLEDAFASL